MPFVPGQLSKERGLEPVYADVPPHLSHQLWDWTAAWLKINETSGVKRMHAVANHMRVSYASVPRGQYLTTEQSMLRHLQRVCQADPVFHLQVIEFLLTIIDNSSMVKNLEEILRLGNSMYAVRADGKGLEYRTDPTAREQIEAALDVADQGAAHWLTEAWNDAYGRDSRPGPSYEASIRAVEAAYRDIVIPESGRGSITQIINAIRDGKPGSKFSFELQDVRGEAAGRNEPEIDTIDTVLSMMRALAYGQRTRHGDSGPVTINSDVEARVAVQLAVTLVQWASAAAFRRSESYSGGA